MRGRKKARKVKVRLVATDGWLLALINACVQAAGLGHLAVTCEYERPPAGTAESEILAYVFTDRDRDVKMIIHVLWTDDWSGVALDNAEVQVEEFGEGWHPQGTTIRHFTCTSDAITGGVQCLPKQY